MPNHVMNQIEIHDFPGNPLHVLAAIASMPDEATKPVLDFERIIPMPDSVFRGNLSAQDEKKYPGEQNWLGWSVANWGTKWNAYESEFFVGESAAAVRFLTAWDHPRPVIEALAKKFPTVTFVVSFADEDFGRNCGTYVIRDRVISISDTVFDDEGDEEWAKDLWGGTAIDGLMEEDLLQPLTNRDWLARAYEDIVIHEDDEDDEDDEATTDTLKPGDRVSTIAGATVIDAMPNGGRVFALLPDNEVTPYVIWSSHRGRDVFSGTYHYTFGEAVADWSHNYLHETTK